jgi:hypothetical protein
MDAEDQLQVRGFGLVPTPVSHESGQQYGIAGCQNVASSVREKKSRLIRTLTKNQEKGSEFYRTN